MWTFPDQFLSCESTHPILVVESHHLSKQVIRRQFFDCLGNASNNVPQIHAAETYVSFCGWKSPPHGIQALIMKWCVVCVQAVKPPASQQISKRFVVIGLCSAEEFLMTGKLRWSRPSRVSVTGSDCCSSKEMKFQPHPQQRAWRGVSQA